MEKIEYNLIPVSDELKRLAYERDKLHRYWQFLMLRCYNRMMKK